MNLRGSREGVTFPMRCRKNTAPVRKSAIAMLNRIQFDGDRSNDGFLRIRRIVIVFTDMIPIARMHEQTNQ